MRFNFDLAQRDTFVDLISKTSFQVYNYNNSSMDGNTAIGSVYFFDDYVEKWVKYPAVHAWYGNYAYILHERGMFFL